MEYEGVFIGGVYSGRENDLDRIREIAHDLQRDINKLLDIRGRLDLYEPPQQDAATKAPSAPARVRQQPLNVTIHQVGQFNLADVLQHAEARIHQVDRRGESQLAEALQQLADVINGASEAAEHQREDALDAVAVLAEVGALPENERGKMRGACARRLEGHRRSGRPRALDPKGTRDRWPAHQRSPAAPENLGGPAQATSRAFASAEASAGHSFMAVAGTTKPIRLHPPHEGRRYLESECITSAAVVS